MTASTSVNKEPAVVSWSGGKDSCLAYYKALQQGYDVKSLVNFTAGSPRRCCFHGVNAGLIQLQAERMGVPLLQKDTRPDLSNYEPAFKETMAEFKSRGIRKAVFGDIYLLDPLNWVERACGQAGMEPVMPLWNAPVDRLVEDFIGLGFKAIITSCRADVLGKEFLGRTFDGAVAAEFKRRGLCPCGENGEFHTLVVDGPLFSKKIDILESAPVLVEGFWKHWSLDIKRFN